MSNLFLHSLTRALKLYDSELYAGRTKDGVPCVFRRHKRWVPVCEGEGFRFLSLFEDKQLVFALTDSWTLKGEPRLWGIDTVLGRIRKHDAWANGAFLDEMDAENDRIDEIAKKDMANEMEAFWEHEHSRFKRATSDILTHSLSKDNKRQILQDRSIKNGNH